MNLRFLGLAWFLPGALARPSDARTLPKGFYGINATVLGTNAAVTEVKDLKKSRNDFILTSVLVLYYTIFVKFFYIISHYFYIYKLA
jgi:hypothetical protein